MAIYKNDKLHFQEKTLSSVTFGDLKNEKIDQTTRPIEAEDYLVDTFYPIYSGKKVSLQCLKPTKIIADGEEIFCNDRSLQFIAFPQEVVINGKIILSVHLPQHFSLKMAKMSNNFDIISQFKPLNTTEPSLVQQAVNFFEVAQPIHWSFFTMLLILCQLPVGLG
jgi:hypothetical protein